MGGRSFIHEFSTGVYQDGVGSNMVQDQPVTAHIYEFTTQLSVDSDLKFKGLEKGIVPTQIIFCMKERNQKKINSHWWMFNAFCPLLQPNVCVLLKNNEIGRGPLALYFKGETLAGRDADVFTSNMYLAEDRILCWELVAKRGHNWVLKYVKSAWGETDVPNKVPEFISQRCRWLNGSFFAAIYSLAHIGQMSRTKHSRKQALALYFEGLYNFLNLLFAWFGLANYVSMIPPPPSRLFSVIPAPISENAQGNHNHQYFITRCFLLSMGNRPQGAKWKYISAMIIFGCLALYMLVACVLILVKAVNLFAPPLTVKGGANATLYAQVVISLIATFGSWITSSVLALDPWHLLTCMLQYLLLAPAYINVLNVYAFANLHEFSWGTKYQNIILTDLGVAVFAGDSKVEITCPLEQKDLDQTYGEALMNLKTRPKLVEKNRSDKEKEALKQDYYKSVRTNVVLLWTLANGIVVACMLDGDVRSSFALGKASLKVRLYMIIILGFVAFMALIRLGGSTIYLGIWLFAG
ncbi:hypothetical protein PtB15_16B98 [Puccinia triticina]|nr:hypothetical protein PtB15_16B98 [Puccinia triticina]